MQLLPELARTAAARHALPAHARPGSCRAAAAPTPTTSAGASPRTPTSSRACAPQLYAEGEARFASRSGDAAASAAAQRDGPRPPRRAGRRTPRCAPRSPPTTRSGASGCCSRTTSTRRVAGGRVTLEASRPRGRRRTAAHLGGERRRRIEVDALVLATGFASTRQPYADLVRGEGGITLAEHWSAGMTSFGSTVVSGFPNLFVLNGPNASLGHNSSVLMIEEQAAYAVRSLRARASPADGVLRVAPAAEARVHRRDRRRPRHPPPGSTGGCRNWYVDERSGRLTLLWPGTVDAFRERLARADGSEFSADAHRAASGARHDRAAMPPDHRRRGDLMTFPLRFGYKASAEQFGPNELLDFASPRRGDGVRLGLRLRPPAAVAARGRPRAGVGPVARRARRAHLEGADRHVGAHADVPLQPDGRRAGLRDARRDVSRARDPRRRHRRGAERGEPRHRVARSARAIPAAQGGDRADPAAVVGGARQLRGRRTTRRATSRSTTSSTTPCRSTSARRVPPRPGSPAASPTASSRRAARSAEPLHRHAAARRCTRASRRPGARRTRSTRSWRSRSRSTPTQRPPCEKTRFWAPLALSARGEDGRRRPDRDAAARRAAADRARRVAVHRLGRPRRARRADRASTSTSASATSSSTTPATTRRRSCAVRRRDPAAAARAVRSVTPPDARAGRSSSRSSRRRVGKSRLDDLAASTASRSRARSRSTRSRQRPRAPAVAQVFVVTDDGGLVALAFDIPGLRFVPETATRARTRRGGRGRRGAEPATGCRARRSSETSPRCAPPTSQAALAAASVDRAVVADAEGTGTTLVTARARHRVGVRRSATGSFARHVALGCVPLAIPDALDAPPRRRHRRQLTEAAMLGLGPRTAAAVLGRAGTHSAGRRLTPRSGSSGRIRRREPTAPATLAPQKPRRVPQISR